MKWDHTCSLTVALSVVPLALAFGAFASRVVVRHKLRVRAARNLGEQTNTAESDAAVATGQREAFQFKWEFPVEQSVQVHTGVVGTGHESTIEVSFQDKFKSQLKLRQGQSCWVVLKSAHGTAP